MSLSPRALPKLGPLETKVLELAWARGEMSVRDAAEGLAPQLAYTTVMTTLDRLFKKGVLQRRRVERAFFYSPRYSRQEMQTRQAGDFVKGLLQAESSPELLISCLVDAVGQYDEALLLELERKVADQREELARNSRTGGEA